MTSEGLTHLVPGFRLDRYELLCPIGAGGMANVWVARLLGKHGFEKLVAVKSIVPRLARDPHFQQMFLDEARIAARIQHLNVAQTLDLGDQNGVLFLAMEWVDGDSLSKLSQSLRDADVPCPPGIAARILADVCAGLHAAHELRDLKGASLGVVHRDISPHNILLGPQGVTKIIDFGIAKARDRATGDTESGSVKGKVKYMSPEQAIAPRTTDRRADIWAVGAVLYWLFADRAPYESDNDMASLVLLAQGRPPAPLPDAIPAPLREVVSRALSWDRDERYATAADLGLALEAAMVEAAIATSSGDVASFCAHHLSARVEARKTAIAIALSAAEERSRVMLLLTPPDEPSRHIPRASQPRIATMPEDLLTITERTTADASHTLGGAGTMSTNLAAPPRSRRGRVIAVAGAVALVAGAIALAAAGTGNGTSRAAAVAGGPASASSPVPPGTTASSPASLPASAPPAAPALAVPSATAPIASGASTASPAATVRSPAAPRERPAPAPAPTPKHRGQYGF